MTINIQTIAAEDIGAEIVHNFGDNMAVVEYENERMVIADVEDMAEFGEFTPISNATKFRNDVSREDRIASMVAKY